MKTIHLRMVKDIPGCYDLFINGRYRGYIVPTIYGGFDAMLVHSYTHMSAPTFKTLLRMVTVYGFCRDDRPTESRNFRKDVPVTPLH